MKTRSITLPEARRLWLHAQRLDERVPFGDGPEATRLAVEHLGYVQIDTINVIERSHHHILFTRIPSYRRAHLHHAQTTDKTVFEYWTHALAYVPTRDFRFFVPVMKQHRVDPRRWYANADPADLRRLLRQIRRSGPVTLRDIDEELIEKDHPWGSRKPSRRTLQLGFYDGYLTISERLGMLKTYELTERHFGWKGLPRAATPAQSTDYLLDRALRAQGLVSGPSVMHPKLRFPADMQQAIDRRIRRRTLVPVTLADDAAIHFAEPEALDALAQPPESEPLVHILSPFDPLVIQRRRLKLFFGYDHVFEAYLPKAKRRFGYFLLPVLVGDEIVATLDLKTDRAAGRLLIQAWHWLEAARPRAHKRMIEEELARFERFQLEP